MASDTLQAIIAEMKKEGDVPRHYIDRLAALASAGPRGWLCTKPALAEVIVRSRERANDWAEHGYTITPLYLHPDTRGADAVMKALNDCHALMESIAEQQAMPDDSWRVTFANIKRAAIKAGGV